MIEEVLQSFVWLVERPLILVWLSVFFVWATYTDVKALKIPNKLNALLAVGNIVLFVIYPLIQGNWNDSLYAVLSALIGFNALLIPAMATGFKMAGDIKFIGALGFAFHPVSMLVFLGIAAVLNLVTNGFLIVTKRKTFEAVIPFAPFFTSSFVILMLMTMI